MLSKSSSGLAPRLKQLTATKPAPLHWYSRIEHMGQVTHAALEAQTRVYSILPVSPTPDDQSTF